MDWNTLNYKKLLGDDKPFDFSDYELEQRKRYNPAYELRKVIAKMTKKPLGRILSETKGWSFEQLKGCVEDSRHNAKKYNNDGGARCNNIIKEVNLKLNKVPIKK